jgi:hypothetical protein
VKRFTLSRGPEVLAEGVVWNDGTVTLTLKGRTITAPTISGALAGEGAGVSILWIDETHEAKPAPKFDLAKHRELMAEWRERNDGGDCGRVANELIAYIDEELAPKLGAKCSKCGGLGTVSEPYLGGTAISGCPNGRPWPPPAARIVNLAPPAYEPSEAPISEIDHGKWTFDVGAFKESSLVELHDAMVAAVRKRAAGKLPSERANEIAVELCRSGYAGGMDWKSSMIEALAKALDEFVGRKAL